MTRGKLPKAYLRIDPNIDQTHPDNLDGFVRLLCAANRQPVRGTFRSRAVLEALLGKANVAKLVARKDLSIAANGTVTVPGWEAWQEGDLTVAERMQRLRGARQSGVTEPSPDSDPDVTPPSPDRIPPSEASRRQGVKAVGVPSSEGTARAPDEAETTDDDPAVALGDRTGTFPRGRLLEWVNDLGAKHGDNRLALLVRSTPMTGNVRDYLEGIADRLRREAHAAERAEAEDERRRNEQKRQPTPLSPAVAALRDALYAKEDGAA